MIAQREKRAGGVPDRRHARAGLSGPRTTRSPTARLTTRSRISTCASVRAASGRREAIHKGDTLIAVVKKPFHSRCSRIRPPSVSRCRSTKAPARSTTASTAHSILFSFSKMTSSTLALIGKLAGELHESEERAYRWSTSRTVPRHDRRGRLRDQRAWVEMKLAEGRSSRAQDRPDLSGDAAGQRRSASPTTAPCWTTCSSGRRHPGGALHRAAREVELAFILGRPLEVPGVTSSMCSRHRYVAPAVEIIDARIEQFDRETSAAPGVRHDRRQRRECRRRPRRPADPTGWTSLGRRLLYSNGVIEETGMAAGVLTIPGTGSPGWRRGWRPGGSAGGR